MARRIRPRFGELGVKTYATEANMERAVAAIAHDRDRWIPCYDADTARWAPVIIAQEGRVGYYAHQGFTVTN